MAVDLRGHIRDVPVHDLLVAHAAVAYRDASALDQREQMLDVAPMHRLLAERQLEAVVLGRIV